MFSGGYKGQKLRVNLRLAINRLKLMEKKKTEMALKARKEIADYLQQHKNDRARIRVEHIIREDYIVEAMELLELYCDLLLARYGLIESMKHCDEGLVEAVSSLIWAAPRMQTDIAEMKQVSEQLILKYGKEFGNQARGNTANTVNERLIHKLSPDPPPKVLVERYLMEIARNFNVSFEPDPEVMLGNDIPTINSSDFNDDFKGGPGIGFGHFNGGSGSGGGGGGGMMGGIPSIPSVPQQPGGMSYPPSSGGASYPPPDASYNGNQAPPLMQKNPYPPGPGVSSTPYPPNASIGSNSGPPPSYTPSAPPPGITSLPDLPVVPSNSLPSAGDQSRQSNGGDDVNFDDLARRFEELKNKK